MTESENSGSLVPDPQPGEAKRGRKRRWVRVAAVIAVGLVLVVALLPTIASMGFVKSIVTSKVNDQINGRVVIDSYSIGWTGGLEVNGLQVFDATNAQILGLKRLKTDLTVLGIIGGSYDLGKATAEDLSFDFKRYADGTNNFAKLAKTPSSGGPITLPNLKGDLTADFHGTIEQQQTGGPTLVTYIDPSTLHAAISDVNSPIKHELDVNVRLEGQKPGKLSVDGAITLCQKNVVDVTKLKEQVALKAEPGSVELSVDAPLAALMALARNQKPGADGKLELKLNFDLALLARTLPQAMRLREGVVVTKGTFAQNTAIDLTADRAVIKHSLDVTSLAGTDQGRAIAAQDIHLTLGASSLGGGGVLPDLRDILLDLRSGFASVKGGGETLAKLNADGGADLAKAKAELGQFVDFGKGEVSGTLAFKVGTSGDVSSADGSANVDATATITNLKLTEFFGQTLAEPWLEFKGLGKLARKGGAIVSIQDADVSLRAGDQRRPSIDLHATGGYVIKDRWVPSFNLDSALDVTALRTELPPLMTALAAHGLDVPRGQLLVTASGSLLGTKLTLAPAKVQTRELAVDRVLAAAQRTSVVKNYSGTIDIVGVINTAPGAMAAELSTLSVSDNLNLLSVQSEGEKLTVDLKPGGGFAASGKLRVDVDVAAANRISEALAPLAAVAGGPADPLAREIRSGRAAGTITFSRAAQQTQTTVAGDLALKQLSIFTGGRATVENEQMTLTFRASAADDLTTLVAQQLSLKSSFLSADVESATLHLKVVQGGKTRAATLFEMVDEAKLSFSVPDGPRAMAVVNAMTPRAATPPAKAGAAAADAEAAVELPAISLDSGSLKGQLAISRDPQGAMVVTVPSLSGSSLALRRGDGQYRLGEVAFALAAQVSPAAADPEKTLMQQIREVRITQLTGRAGSSDRNRLADISMTEAIVVTGLDGSPAVNGAIKVNGQVREVCELLTALAAAKPGTMYDYDGAFTVNQRIVTQQGVISPVGQIDVANFVAGKTFRESGIHIANDLRVEVGKTLSVQKLDVTMDQNSSIAMAVRGSVLDYARKREFKDLRVLLSYDAAKLLEMIKPGLSPEVLAELDTLKVAGVVKEQAFVVTGSFPAVVGADPRGLKAKKSLKQVKLVGAVPVESIEYLGMKTQGLVIPLRMEDGVLATVIDGKPSDQQFAPPASCSGGQLDLGGFQLDLSAAHPRLTTMRANQNLLKGVAITQQFAERFLGNVHPLFTGTKDVRGFVTLTIVKCDRLPVDAFVTNKGSDGEMVANLSIEQLQLKSNFATEFLARQLNLTKEKDGTLAGAIHNAKITVAKGEVVSDLGLVLGQQTLAFQGGVALGGNRDMNMNVGIPKAMLQGLFGQDVIRVMPANFTVPLGGTLAAPKFDIKSAVMENVKPGNLLQGLPGLLEGKKK